MNYLDFMNQYTNYYNRTDVNNILKNSVLFKLLIKMYKNKFDKNINIGVLLQTLTNHSGNPLAAALSYVSKEKLVFDEEHNELKIGELFSVKETNDLKGEPCISIQVTDSSTSNQNRFILGKDENSLVIERVESRSMYGNIFGSSQKTYSTKSVEKRIFDFAGIEIERQIIDTVALGVDKFSINFSDIEERTGQFVSGIDHCIEIKNETTISRDPNCFIIAKIESDQEICFRLPGKKKMRLGMMEQDISSRPMGISNMCYCECYSGQSLGIGTKYDTYEEAIFSVLGVFEYFTDDFLSEKIIEICPRCIEIPELNNEIKKRFEASKVYCKDYYRKHNK